MTYESSYSFVQPGYSDIVYGKDDHDSNDDPAEHIPVGRIVLKKQIKIKSDSQKALDEEQARMQKLVDDYLNDRG